MTHYTQKEKLEEPKVDPQPHSMPFRANEVWPATVPVWFSISHPIHYVAFDPEYRKRLSSNFGKAFGIDITPNIFNGRKIPLCLGEHISLKGEYADGTRKA